MTRKYEYDEKSLNYELTFSDEFDTDGLPDPDKWGYDVGGHGWGNAELQYYTAGKNAAIRDGKLMITARKEQFHTNAYTSAKLTTRGRGDWLYGKFEIRAKLPKGIGSWPAIWMLPSDWAYGDWPDSGEIDIMEHVGHDQDNIVGSVHTGRYNHVFDTQKSQTVRVKGASEDFHVYALEWLPDKIKLFIDGVNYFTYSPYDFVSDPGSGEWPFDKRFYLILNIAVGGGWGGAEGVAHDLCPAVMEVDYVRVWQAPEITRHIAEKPPLFTVDMALNERVQAGSDALGRSVGAYVTTDENNMLVKSGDLLIEPGAEAGGREALWIDPLRQRQTIVGFGASFTDSSAYLMNRKLSPEKRSELLTKLFDAERGIGLSFVRNPMGSSDYARTVYSYDDVAQGEEDFDLQRFSIAHDEEDIIPLLKDALALNPQLKIMASPWSPPGWMKTSGSMIGGALREDCYEVYGDYFIEFLRAYQKAGLDIFAVTPQNEPLYVPGHYPGSDMPAGAEAEFINKSLGPKLKESGVKTKLICYDHNWDRPDYPMAVLEQAGKYVHGVAWHVYGGGPSAQSIVKTAFPASEAYFTEASGGEWIPPFHEAFLSEMAAGIGVLNNSSRSIVLWNFALDEKNGPTVPGFGQSTCRGVVTIDEETGSLKYNLDYYVLAHFSKFIRPGAINVQAESRDGLLSAACLDVDYSRLAVVFANTLDQSREVRFVIGDFHFDYDAPAKSAATFVLQLTV